MITDEAVKQLVENSRKILRGYRHDGSPFPTQIYWGVTPRHWRDNPHKNKCERHMLVFETYGIIPKYCFDCYKILVQPKTVVDLFKLLLLFIRLKLPSDNTRKCCVETRPEIPGSYKGFIYSQSLNEAKEILQTVKNAVAVEIASEIPVSLKRGCSEYLLKYPDYAIIEGYGNQSAMEYPDDWKKYEDLADKNNIDRDIRPSICDTYADSRFTLKNALVMRAWLHYAATIEDLSYLRISKQALAKSHDLKRPDKQK